MLSLTPLSARPWSTAIEGTVMTVLASAGGFTLSGQAANLRAFRRIPAAAASFVITGQDVALLITFSPAALNRVALFGSTSTLTGAQTMRNNFVMVAGDTKTLVVTVTDANGSPVNLSGCTIAWRASRSFRKTAQITKTTTGSGGVAITDGPNGVFTVALEPEDTEDLHGDLLHEAQVTDAQGTISTVLQGTMKVNRALIRAS